MLFKEQDWESPEKPECLWLTEYKMYVEESAKSQMLTTLHLHRWVGRVEIGVLMCLQTEAKHRVQKDG
jgi:hypothetical protein